MPEKKATLATSAGDNSSVAALPHRIITLTHEFFPRRGGIATYTREIANGATARGYQVEVWAPEHKRLIEAEFPFTVRSMPVRGTQSWPCRLALAWYLRKHRTDWRDELLYMPEPGPLRAWMYLQMLSGRHLGRLVITLHGSEIERFSRPFYRHHLFTRLLQKADRIGVVSGYCHELLQERFPEVDPAKIILAHGALRSDLLDIDVVTNKPSSADGIIRLLTVGRLHPRKGQQTVIEALGRLPEDLRRRIHYTIVGPVVRPAYFQRICQLANRYGVTLQHLPDVEDEALSEIYAQADIFVMTSQAFGLSVEGFGLTYLEAGAHGLPVIANRIGGVSDAVRHMKTGLKVELGDYDALADAIRRLSDDHDLRKKLGANGLQWAHQFSWERTAGKLFDGLAVRKMPIRTPQDIRSQCP